MKRKFVVPTKPQGGGEGEQRRPRERRVLGLKYDLVSGDSVSGLR